MTIRALIGASILSISICAQVSAAASADATPPTDPSAPVIIRVASVDVAEEGDKDDANATFGIVNLSEATCYAIAPPTGALIEVGESYAVVPASEVAEEVRAKLKAAYPKCAIVQTVAHVVAQ